MCLDHHIPLTEDLAEKMSLPKDHADSAYRATLLEKVAECAFKQGSFHLATKKFTQAGNKMKVSFGVFQWAVFNTIDNTAYQKMIYFTLTTMHQLLATRILKTLKPWYQQGMVAKLQSIFLKKSNLHVIKL